MLPNTTRMFSPPLSSTLAVAQEAELVEDAEPQMSGADQLDGEESEEESQVLLLEWCK